MTAPGAREEEETMPESADERLAKLLSGAIENDDLAWKSLLEVTGAVETFLNPVLDSAECGTWEPSSWLGADEVRA